MDKRHLTLSADLGADHAAEAIVAEDVGFWAAAGDKSEDFVRREFIGAEAAGYVGHHRGS